MRSFNTRLEKRKSLSIYRMNMTDSHIEEYNEHLDIDCITEYEYICIVMTETTNSV